MTFTLFDLIVEAVAETGQMKYATATDGSTTTITVSNLGDGGRESGTIFIIESTDGDAPQGEWSAISEYSESDSQFTLKDELTEAVEADDRFAYAGNRYSLEMLRERPNRALSMLGEIDLVDKSITTADDQQEYTLPVAMKGTIKKVEIQTLTTDSDRNRWEIIPDWSVEPAAAGSTGLLVFYSQPESGKLLRITYTARHPKVRDPSDVINEVVPEELAVQALVVQLYRYNMRRGAGQRSLKKQLLDDAQDEFDKALEKEGFGLQSAPHATSRWGSSVAKRSRRPIGRRR